MFKKIILISLMSLPMLIFAQFQIQGKVNNKNTAENLEGASLQLVGTSAFSISNNEGKFVFKNIPRGAYILSVSYLGYAPYEQQLNLTEDQDLNIQLKPRVVLSDEIIVSAIRASDNSPATFFELNKREIQENNHGKDLPFILNTTPSLVVTSDAGTGVGYTNFSIRGTDISRINVTINGIPMNDAESHSVYFVDLPDLATSLDNIQIQRGVGTSSNGAAAFGASVNLQTKHLNQYPYAGMQSSIGSYNTFRNSVSFGTGLLKNKMAFDGRLSKINSDGYIDRSAADLKSIYFSAGYYGKNDILKFTLLSGSEQTYQAWYGIPKVRLNNDEQGMLDLASDNWWDTETTNNLLNSNSRTYNYYTYDNEIDNYQQDYYQLHYSHFFSSEFQISTALFYTLGKGYYEQFKTDRKFEDYLFEEIVVGGETINLTDLIQQKWLDNHFYGITASLTYQTGKMESILGGAITQYDGDHFGEVIWAEFAGDNSIRSPWYLNTGLKTDGNIFAKTNYKLSNNLLAYIDLQYRFINYSIEGTHDDLRDISQTHNFNFFNPKAGLFYQFNNKNQAYTSFAIANREPSRGNYRDADADYQPKPERLYDFELGYNHINTRFSASVNLYFMNYKDQLVATGKINNVGDAIMTNVAKSYRSGIELSGTFNLNEKLDWMANFTFSQNKILDFVQYIDDWDNWNQQAIELGTTNILLSPDKIGSSTISYRPVKNLSLSLISKFVGRQFVDNTSNLYNSIDPYFANDLSISYQINPKAFKSIELSLLISNIFSEEYETYGWAYNYIYNGQPKVMDGYFPMAPLNFLFGVNIHF
ncbi:MAG: TonB-dependent receptor [Bacteroidales bacterium]|jgi:iron complex outermembrane receptor protein|nr:TonB-dependent receptor [Bacteroidales bacterium]